ncbi:MAG TPA: M67 family metallopeptidase [Solirubrobacteraceae bacterium]
MRISRPMYDDMVAHARADAPNECCGILSTSGGQAQRLYRVPNTEASALKFVMDPREQLRVYTEIDDAGLDLGAIYHSHTRSAPYPSQTDINFSAPWPGVVWIIVGLADGDPEVRAYEISDGRVAEAELTVD